MRDMTNINEIRPSQFKYSVLDSCKPASIRHSATAGEVPPDGHIAKEAPTHLNIFSQDPDIDEFGAFFGINLHGPQASRGKKC